MKWKIRVLPPAGYTSFASEFTGDKVTIGRDAACDMVLRFPSVSRSHATLALGDDGIVVEDQGSTNGTAIVTPGSPMSEPVTSPTTLKPGQRVVIATEITLELLKSPTPPSPESSLFESRMVDISELSTDAAIMVLDLCGSSAMAYSDDRMAYHLKQRLGSISKTVLDAKGVNFHKDTGDGFLATFADARSAWEAGSGILDLLAQRNRRTSNPPIDVRISLHHGSVFSYWSGGEDIHGSDVNITFRLDSIKVEELPSPPGDIPEKNRVLCTGAFVEQLNKEDCEHDCRIEECGMTEVKGISDAINIFWLSKKR